MGALSLWLAGPVILAVVAGALAAVMLLLAVSAVVQAFRRRAERRRNRNRPADSVLLDDVAEAIATVAGHCWHADMMPAYRAEFRRKAAAAIEVMRGRA